MAIFDKISGIPADNGFKYQAEAPLDARLVVELYADLSSLVTEHGAYDGMLVYVKATKKYYSYSISGSTGTWTEFKGTDTIVTPGNGTLTIKRNGTQIGTFTANQSTASEVNIDVPTGSAALKDVDTSIAADSTSTNLPTSHAVAVLVASAQLKDEDGKVVDLSKYALKATNITAGAGLTGGGDLSTDQSLAVGAGNGITVSDDAVAAKAGNGITVDATGINHADTSSQASVTPSERKYITGVTLDTYGHVTGLTTGTETNQPGYLGTVNALTGLSKTAKAGDFYRVSAPFDIPLKSAAGSNTERAHLGDILMAIKDSPQEQNLDNNWDILHNDAGVTGVQLSGNGNAVTTAGLSDGVLTLTKGTTFATADEVGKLISHGTADPTASITSKYYFKY